MSRYEETNKLSADESFTILDGIIGKMLEKREFNNVFGEKIEESLEELEGLTDPIEIQAAVDWMGAGAEVETQYRFHPIAKKKWEYSYLVTTHKSNSFRYAKPITVYEPHHDKYDYFPAEDKELERIGCRVEIGLKRPMLPVVELVWIRNLSTRDFSEVAIKMLAEEIAEYLAYKRAYSQIRNLFGS